MTIENARLSPDEIRRRVGEFEWYHKIDLGGGVTTPGEYDLEPLLPHYGLPESLEGKSVLDVGPGHGYFAFEFERRGAAKVATSELPTWTEHDASPELQEFFHSVPESAAEYHRGALGFAIQAKGSRVERHFHSVYDLTPDRVGTYDLVFCASVLLHLTDPLRAMYGIRRVCRDQAIISTGIDTHLHVANQSRALFIGTATGQAFWLPTMKCLENMLLAAGFARVERVSTFSLKSVDGKFDTPHGTLRAFVT
jgi:tRNA (mo5U34)-methyltransferase